MVSPNCQEWNYAWIAEIRDQCVVQNTAFFFKQWGGVKK
ncbi:MAG: hypothetical protein DSY90_06645 [Deltaproteobacteria bacterium]|nr:MAG: hypothetical protein DSY90_06645 [Deltaproteobacteria bacterium]